MWRIRKAQMAAFARIAQERFEERLVGHVRRHFPAACERLDAVAVRERVSEAVSRAARHGIVVEADACRYVELAFLLGERFDEEPWATRALAHPSPHVKISVLVARAVERLGGPGEQ